MSVTEKSLKDLETWLGNDHNLVVLRARIVAEPAFYGKQKDIDLALDLIDRYQKSFGNNRSRWPSESSPRNRASLHAA